MLILMAAILLFGCISKVHIYAIMSSHKRKHSLYDAPVDLIKMQLAKQRLQALQEELSGIEETTDEMKQIMMHVDALQDILHTTKKLVCGHSTTRSVP
jgi:hypothetical protein